MSVICEDCGHLNWYNARFPAGTPSAQRAELADIQHQLEVLKTRERDLEAALASVVYPVLTLPPEITSRIFLKCLPFHGRVQPSATKAPLVLAQVCRHWRDVALATARLWSSIDLEFQNIPDNGTIPLLRTWLSRAKRSPISLMLQLPYDQPISKEVLSVIPSYAAQLRWLELRASASDCEALRVTCSDFPVLRDLAMTCYGSGPGPLSIFRNASSLREIRLPYRSFPNGVFFQSYLSLHTLQLREMSVATLVHMLTDFPQLLHLDTGISDYTPFDNAGVVPVTANLESLIIQSREDAPDPPVLDYLTLPKLCRLELHHPPQLQALSSFRIRSACILEHLALQVSSYTEVWELMRILLDFSGIISLDLDTYVHLDSFTHGLQDTTFLPHLRSLRLNSWRDGINYASLVWCLRIRNRDRKILKSFTLTFDNPRVSELAGIPTEALILAELESVVADGLKVQIWSSEGVWPSETDRTVGKSCFLLS
ncbi:hypothetical protein DFH07DRAFT_966693 [Mycena maculata]|uniref:F-box domain-containing protein n=1 Tax=Mycena maculata TaxID=230809 RepID=A0AAD7I7U9_9AGAR|nr:hypothetical protein DFH07DRAFT_966693 [Mycena maculata]